MLRAVKTILQKDPLPLVRPRSAIFAPAQFFDQVRKMRGQARGLQPEVLLQPLSNGLTNRTARLVVNRFAIVIDSIVHDALPPGDFKAMSNQVIEAENVSGKGPGSFGFS
jgi:hypothetical protein